MIPVFVLTGFLGSGKTTLLARMLRSPLFARTAVIINEFGEVGLDHDLVETSNESFVELQTGCLCCTIRSDLVRTLEDVLARRDAGKVTQFERIVIETSGLADPAPILHALMNDDGLAERVTLSGVVTTVDAVNGLDTLNRQHESAKQIAVADRIVVTKTDLLEHPPTDLLARLAALNPDAEVLTASFGDADPACLFDGVGPAGRPPQVGARPGNDRDHADEMHFHHRHEEDITYFHLIRDDPIPAVALTLLLEILAEHCGADLLRMKGIVNVAESGDRPAVIHGVQHVFHAPAWLDRWPSADRSSRIVFITRNVSPRWVATLLDAVESEVRLVAAREPTGSEIRPN